MSRTRPESTIEPTKVAFTVVEPAKRNHFSLAFRLILTAVVLMLSAFALFGQGASAVFTSAQTQNQSAGSGALTLAMSASGVANRMSVAASGLAPGDTVQRVLTVLNTGSVDFASLSLTTTATVSSTLNTDTTGGLQVTIDECSVAWTESGTSPNYSYTCGGTLSNRLASQPVIFAGATLPGSNIVALGSRYYMITLALPAASAASNMSKSSTIQYQFTAAQRAGRAM